MLKLIGWMARHARLIQACEWVLGLGLLAWGLYSGDGLWVACAIVAILLNAVLPISRATGLLPRIVRRAPARGERR